MSVRQITTRLSTDGEAEYKRQMSDATRAIQTQKTELQLLEAQFKGQMNTTDALTEKDRILRAEIEQQQEKVKALAQAVVDASAAYGDADKRTDGYRQSLNRAQRELIEMNRELEQTEKYLDEAAKSADGTADSIDGFGREIGDTKSPLGDFGDALGTLKGALAGGAIIGGIKEVADAILDVEESTREYRTIMGTLETSSQQAGYSADDTKEAYLRLYGVLGDTQTTATAVANLQSLGIEHEDVMAFIDATTGAWSTYGDSIPIDQLAESIDLAAKQSEVSGPLADVIDKMGGSTEDFTKKLQEANTTEERAQIILDELSKHGLADAGQAWRDINEDIVEANESQARMEEAMGKLGESLSPVANAIRNFGADAIEWLADKITDAMDAWNDFWSALTSGDLNDETNQRRAASRGYSVDGSHAGGLSYVPWDGYRAELHQGEAVLRADEAALWRSMQAGVPAQQTSVSTQDLQQVMSAAVNAINTGQTAGPQTIVLQMNVNGRRFYEETIQDLRAVDAANPEVTDDR